MTQRTFTGLFVAEGTSDAPLAGVVEALFFERGIPLRLSAPDFSMLKGKVAKDVKSKVEAGVQLIGMQPDVVVVHRDSDNVNPAERRTEIETGVSAAANESHIVPIIPVRMTEAWLLLDEQAIRTVAGNPRGRKALNLPRTHEIESRPDPKSLLSEYILTASELTGRRRDKLSKRFSHNRRQLLERLNPDGAIRQLSSWRSLVSDIERVAAQWQHI